MASNVEDVSIWWRHHGLQQFSNVDSDSLVNTPANQLETRFENWTAKETKYGLADTDLTELVKVITRDPFY